MRNFSQLEISAIHKQALLKRSHRPYLPELLATWHEAGRFASTAGAGLDLDRRTDMHGLLCTGMMALFKSSSGMCLRGNYASCLPSRSHTMRRMGPAGTPAP